MDQQKALLARKFERAAGGTLPHSLVAGLEAAAEKGLGFGLRIECSGLAEATSIKTAIAWAEGTGEGVLAFLQTAHGPGPGFLHADPALVLAATELLTGGDAPRPEPPHQPRGTAAEAALTGRLIDLWFAEFQKIALRDGLVPALAGCRPRRAERFAEGQPHLPDGRFRFIRLGLDLGTRGRHGTLTLALSADLLLAEGSVDAGGTDWSGPMLSLANSVRPRLACVLTRERLSLRELARLGPGSILPLAGARMPRVRVETRSRSGGTLLIAEADLGASEGFKALQLR
jgi:flagellar motor switch/type III secretory pathway protein FliN